ncbi:QcrA and Rieske domain-containing protein [Paracraurococcus lichenis]|uniref:Rieske (2Fe-2S) protein n=1 Tax=Paracraurococcus lichenis TaxID=3064888 RepID=A0ABT9DUT0_9PROT|nr:Rieske (2Fe-2S) protein [Paracraurococcus sp. LOR1-02]MDO9707654.1 Rieske (2Fe-2S) protein [Paracraurococcus sp. LOR1-02]
MARSKASSATRDVQSSFCITPDPEAAAGRRALLGATTAGVVLAGLRDAAAQADPATARPKHGDHLIHAYGEKEGQPLQPDDLAVGGPQVLAWAKDPASGTVRSGSRLNLVLLIRMDPATLQDQTRARAADGIVAYSAICTHEQCPVADFKKEKDALHCPCHGSEFDPAKGGVVVGGPAPRALPALPVGLKDGTLVVAGNFTSRVGGVRT